MVDTWQSTTGKFCVNSFENFNCYGILIIGFHSSLEVIALLFPHDRYSKKKRRLFKNRQNCLDRRFSASKFFCAEFWNFTHESISLWISDSEHGWYALEKQYSFSPFVHIVCMPIVASILALWAKVFLLKKHVSAKSHSSFVNIFLHVNKCFIL